MGITKRKLKSGKTIFLVQKRVNMHRESKTFIEREDAEKWLKEKTAENILALSKPDVYDEPLKRKLDKAPPPPKWGFEWEENALHLFRTDHLKLTDLEFRSIFNSVATYEHTPEIIKRYKKLIAKSRKNKNGSN